MAPNAQVLRNDKGTSVYYNNSHLIQLNLLKIESVLGPTVKIQGCIRHTPSLSLITMWYY